MAKTSNVDELKKISDRYEKTLDIFEENMNSACDYREGVNDTRKALGDF